MDVLSYAMSRKYVQDTANKLGAVKGAPCTINGIVAVSGGHNVEFSWVGEDGTKQTEIMFVRDGAETSVDNTLTKHGKAADAAATGEALASLSEEIEQLKETGGGGTSVNWGVDNAGKLLYIANDGETSPIIVDDGLEVFFASGKNIVKEEWENARWNAADGSYQPITSGTGRAMVKGFIPVNPGETYTMSYKSLNGLSFIVLYIAQYDKNEVFLGEIPNTSNKKYTFTVNADAAYIRVLAYSSGAPWENVVPIGFMIEAGAAATEYEPYQAASARIKVSQGLHAATADVAEGISNVAYATHAPSLTVKSIAHRGAPDGAPECTAHAYFLAKKLGFTVAENDVALTADGKYVMWHDTTLKSGNLYDIDGRAVYKDTEDNYYFVFSGSVYTYDPDNDQYITSNVNVADLTLVNGSAIKITEQPYWLLRRIDVGRWKDAAKYAGTQMLSFEEWIQLCKELGMECYIDQKFQFSEEQAAELVSIVRRKGMLRKCSWLGSLENVRKADPKARCGLLYAPTEGYLVENGLYDKALKEGGEGSVFWNPSAADVTAENAEMALAAGYGYECWYVGTAKVADEQYYAEVGRLL